MPGTRSRNYLLTITILIYVAFGLVTSVIGFLVGSVGDAFGMHAAMMVNLIAFTYVFAIAIWGKGKLNMV